MKKNKAGTWIAIGCVLSAVLVTQIYNGFQNEAGDTEDISVISETFPTPPPPIATPSVKITPSPEPVIETSGTKIESVTASTNIKPEEKPEFYLPSSGEITQTYSDKTLIHFSPIKEWRCHLGIDFVPAENDLVLATADGVVEKIYTDHLFGTTIIIDHGQSLKSSYGSLSAVTVSEGQSVSAGTEIGKMGDSSTIEEGVHLHFAMEKDGKAIHPMGEK